MAKKGGSLIENLRTERESSRWVGSDHKDDSLLAYRHCRPLDRAESKWQTVTRLAGSACTRIANYSSCGAAIISRPNNRDRFMQISTITLPTSCRPFHRFRRIKSSIVRSEIRLLRVRPNPQELYARKKSASGRSDRFLLSVLSESGVNDYQSFLLHRKLIT